MRRSGRQDAILVGSLIIFGLTLVIAAYVSAPMFAQRVLHTTAGLTAAQWSERAGRIFTADGDPAAAAFALRDEARRDGVLELDLVGPDGAVRVSERIGIASALRGSVGEVLVPEADLARALAGDTVLRLRAEGERHISEAMVPARHEGQVVGAARLVIDQTATASVLETSLGVFSAVTALLVWIAFFIPAILMWRRLKERIAAEARIHHLAHHDTLTELPNRLLFNDRLDRALARARRGSTHVAVMCLDLDRFKEVNDNLGHHVGDELLKTVARRLEESVRDVDTVARLGGDEFSVIVEDIKTTESLIAVATRIVDSLGQPHIIDGHQVVAAASIGIAVTPTDGLESSLLMKNADRALYRAKSEGRGTFRFFESGMDAEVQDRRELERDLREAVNTGGFTIHYQAQHDLGSQEVVGYEALVRWNRPGRGEVPPNRFIPIAEESGLIVPLGAWVLERACRDAAGWPSHLKVAVNFSPAQFRNRDIGSVIERVLQETGLDPRRLEIEITEALLMRNTDAVIAQLTKIRALGVTIAMDDFGTGYSSLSYLARFPFDKIKIDKSFIQMLTRDPNVAAIVNTIIGLGTTLSMTISAEGVETREQATVLEEAGCEQAQGYLYHRPGPLGPEAEQGEAPRPDRAVAPSPAATVDADTPLPPGVIPEIRRVA